jgi:nitrate reductase alpha subunit
MDPDDPHNWPRNMFVWRSNLLGSSGKGHEYFLKHLLGTTHGVQGKDLGERGATSQPEVVWHDEAPEGKARPAGDARLPHVDDCVYSDIVLPTATWYEKNDLNTSDMHPFIHPLARRWIRPGSRSDWEIFKGIAKTFSEVAPEVLGVEKDVVLTPIQHDSAGELAQPFDVKDWEARRVRADPGQDHAAVTVVERDYPNLYKRFTALGPLMDKLGNGGKGIAWNTEHEVELCWAAQRRRSRRRGRPRACRASRPTSTLRSDPDAGAGDQRRGGGQGVGGAEKFTGREHAHLALPKEDEKIRFRDIVAQPRKIISSPTWSGIESEKVCYNAGYTNVHELIPWRTLTGRQQLYQDHLWMRAFGEALVRLQAADRSQDVKP